MVDQLLAVICEKPARRLQMACVAVPLAHRSGRPCCPLLERNGSGMTVAVSATQAHGMKYAVTAYISSASTPRLTLIPRHRDQFMAYFTHRFETKIARHCVGTMAYTVVLLDPTLQDTLPLREFPRLRVEADVAGVAIKGAWQPAKGIWYLMLPKAPLKQAGLSIGDSVEVAFRVVAQDDVDVPMELADRLASDGRLRLAWAELTPGAQRGLAHFVSSAKRIETRTVRLERVEAALLGTAPLPWSRTERRNIPAKK